MISSEFGLRIIAGYDACQLLSLSPLGQHFLLLSNQTGDEELMIKFRVTPGRQNTLWLVPLFAFSNPSAL